MNELFSGLSILIVIGAAVAMFMRYIGQPLLIGHIITGIIVGPAFLQIVSSDEELRVFGELGIALLLFIIGLGLNPNVIKEVGRASFAVTFSQITLTTLAGFLVGVALGLERIEALFLGLGFAISSTIVALKLLSDKKEQGRLYGKLTIGATLVEDIVAAVLLLLVASAQNGEWLSLDPLLSLTIKGLAIGLSMYVVTARILPKMEKFLASDQELLFLFAIAWGLGTSALLAQAGFSLALGALAAGVFLAPRPYAQEVASRLRPLRDFFVIVFFITLGAGLTFDNFNDLILPIIGGLAVVMFFKPLVILSVLGLLGYTKRTSFKAAITLTHVSEFSLILVILGVSQGLIEQRVVTILTFVALVSIAFSTYLITYSDQVYGYFEKYLGMFERRKTHDELVAVKNYELVLFGYQRGGHEFVGLFKKLKKKYVVIDYDPEVIDILERRKINYLYGDAMDPELLEEAGINHATLVVSTIPDFQINSYLLHYLARNNPKAVVIAHGDDPLEAAKLYEEGASYVVLPHYIGSEKISSFIYKSGLNKTAFHKQRLKHLDYLEKHYGALEKLSELHNKKVGRGIIKAMVTLTQPRA
ncbi:cation:proton antiporter [Candidatus Saccharibacteria bacterium]|nr:cation:proton antiporter [Candidatus Saccharibacteria bacterium]